MDFNNIPSLEPIQEIDLSLERENEIINKKEKSTVNGSNSIDSYLSYHFIKDYFTPSKNK